MNLTITNNGSNYVKIIKDGQPLSTAPLGPRCTNNYVTNDGGSISLQELGTVHPATQPAEQQSAT
jgi:hypothetical protein